ncbi:hypothetical protein PR048_029696 [Dryococelus australis]|uniref:Uncharacterized protein n=1 Tax=Dryococelus australis TaxID=614101 RepID=A0ABQ9GG30_9NEOP|nr:hypothetical protein PR048_029696 [Dryococelus australis]
MHQAVDVQSLSSMPSRVHVYNRSSTFHIVDYYDSNPEPPATQSGGFLSWIVTASLSDCCPASRKTVSSIFRVNKEDCVLHLQGEQGRAVNKEDRVLHLQSEQGRLCPPSSGWTRKTVSSIFRVNKEDCVLHLQGEQGRACPPSSGVNKEDCVLHLQGEQGRLCPPSSESTRKTVSSIFRVNKEDCVLHLQSEQGRLCPPSSGEDCVLHLQSEQGRLCPPSSGWTRKTVSSIFRVNKEDCVLHLQGEQGRLCPPSSGVNKEDCVLHLQGEQGRLSPPSSGWTRKTVSSIFRVNKEDCVLHLQDTAAAEGMCDRVLILAAQESLSVLQQQTAFLLIAQQSEYDLRSLIHHTLHSTAEEVVERSGDRVGHATGLAAPRPPLIGLPPRPSYSSLSVYCITRVLVPRLRPSTALCRFHRVVSLCFSLGVAKLGVIPQQGVLVALHCIRIREIQGSIPGSARICLSQGQYLWYQLWGVSVDFMIDSSRPKVFSLNTSCSMDNEASVEQRPGMQERDKTGGPRGKPAASSGMIPNRENPRVAVTLWLGRSPPVNASRVRYPAGSLPVFTGGNRAGRHFWSAGFLRDIPFPPAFVFRPSVPVMSLPCRAVTRSKYVSSLQRGEWRGWLLFSDWLREAVGTYLASNWLLHALEVDRHCARDWLSSSRHDDRQPALSVTPVRRVGGITYASREKIYARTSVRGVLQFLLVRAWITPASKCRRKCGHSLANCIRHVFGRQLYYYVSLTGVCTKSQPERTHVSGALLKGGHAHSPSRHCRVISSMRTQQPGSMPQYQTVDPYILLYDDLKHIYEDIRESADTSCAVAIHRAPAPDWLSTNHTAENLSEDGLGKELAMAFVNDPSQHSPGVISKNHGKLGIEPGSSRIRVHQYCGHAQKTVQSLTVEEKAEKKKKGRREKITFRVQRHRSADYGCRADTDITLYVQLFVTSRLLHKFTEALLKFYFQDITPPHANKD